MRYVGLDVHKKSVRACVLDEQGQAPQIARTLHRARRFVQDWVYRYRDGGVVALEDKPRSGKRCKLDEPEQQRFRQRMLAGPIDSDGVFHLLPVPPVPLVTPGAAAEGGDRHGV